MELEGAEAASNELPDAAAVNDRATSLACQCAAARTAARQNIEKAQAVQKERYDLKHKKAEFQVGDKVLRYNRRRNTRMGDKLHG